MEFTKSSKLQDASQLQTGRLSQTHRPNQLLQPKQDSIGSTSPTNSGGKASIVKQDDPICTVEVTCGALNVRSDASTSAARIGGVTLGKVLNVYEVKDGWLRIGYGTQYGWVMTKYTTYKEEPVVVDPPSPPHTCVEDLHAKYGTIQKDSKGDGVKVLQQYLNQYLKPYGVPTLSEDGNFVKQTFINLCYYQYSRNLQSGSKICVDGICGSDTWKAICTNAPEVYDLTTPKIFSAYQYKGKFEGMEIKGSQKGKLAPNAAVSYNKMYDAAQTEGYDITASNSFRGMTKMETKAGSDQNKNGQIEFYADKEYGTGNDASNPGSSNHQQGLAVDIYKINSTSDKEYEFFSENDFKNAKTYHFRPLPKEAWHFSYDPSYK